MLGVGVGQSVSFHLAFPSGLGDTDSNLEMAGTGGTRIRKARQDRTLEEPIWLHQRDTCSECPVYLLSKSPAVMAVAAHTGPTPSSLTTSRFDS